jgi:hypothetical protein
VLVLGLQAQCPLECSHRLDMAFECLQAESQSEPTLDELWCDCCASLCIGQGACVLTKTNEACGSIAKGKQARSDTDTCIGTVYNSTTRHRDMPQARMVVGLNLQSFGVVHNSLADLARNKRLIALVLLDFGTFCIDRCLLRSLQQSSATVSVVQRRLPCFSYSNAHHSFRLG